MTESPLDVSVITLKDFRNFQCAEFKFGQGKTIICGDNGSGKSNLLEALYFLAISKSGRGSKDREVLRWGSEYFTVKAGISREDQVFDLRIVYDPRVGKKAFLKENPLSRISDLIGVFNAVLFSPEDVNLVLRYNSERRRILDVLVSQSSSLYLADLNLYHRVLAQRNRLLKDLGRGLLSNPRPLDPWTYQLAKLGGRIIDHRLTALTEIRPLVQEYYQHIAPKSECLQAIYKSSISNDQRHLGEEILVRNLKNRFPKEVELGFTLCGPHRDNFIFTLDNREAQKFGSMGQLKSILLAWKLAEASFLEARTGRKPVLLMDDVFSELDRKRADSLLEIFSTLGQVIITSARDPDLGFHNLGCCLIQLKNNQNGK